MLAACASPDREVPSGRGVSLVIPPEAGPALERAFAEDGASLRLEGARLEPERISLRACAAGSCFEVALTDPSGCAAKERLGPFCARIPDGLGAEAREGLARALARIPEGTAWVDRDSRGDGSGGAAGVPSRLFADGVRQPEAGFQAGPRDSHPYLTALGVLLFPFALGWALARGARFSLIRILRRVRPGSRFTEASAYRGRALGAGLVLGPLLIGGLLPPHRVGVGFWDLLLAGCLVGLGAVLGIRGAAGRVRWREIALGAASIGLALVLLECAARWLLPPPPAFPPPEAASLWLPRFYSPEDSETWAQLYPEQYPAAWARRQRIRASARVRVLHVGDSMTYGAGVPFEGRFTTLLDARSEAAAHVNAAVPATGPDFQLLVIDQWLRRVPLDLVVLHLYMGNDLLEMDRPYPVCDDEPLLRYGPDGPEPRCPQPVWGSGGRRLQSPAPYPLRVATSFSAAARHLCALLWRVAHRQLAPFDEALAWQHLEIVLAAMQARTRAHGVALVVDLIPYRDTLEGAAAPVRTPHVQYLQGLHEKMAALVRRLGIQMIDPWPLFAGRVARDGGSAYFLDQPPGDGHFDSAGHRLLADWLADELPRFLPPPPR
jgi:hypothetical protein